MRSHARFFLAFLSVPFRFRSTYYLFVLCLFINECARTSHQRLHNPPPPPQTKPQIPPPFRAQVPLPPHHRHSLTSPLRRRAPPPPPPPPILPPIRSKTTATRIRSTSRIRSMTTMKTRLPVNFVIFHNLLSTSNCILHRNRYVLIHNSRCSGTPAKRHRRRTVQISDASAARATIRRFCVCVAQLCQFQQSVRHDRRSGRSHLGPLFRHIP